jgi:hypothetical protein
LIYSKDATFPYPVLIHGSENYKENEFLLDVELQENNNEYRFLIDYSLDSDFLNDLVQSDRAELIFIVQSKDSKFYYLNKDEHEIRIPKNRISLSKRTTLQLIIRANEQISLKDNLDLNEFYNDIRSDVFVPAHGVMGLSNIVLYDGNNKKPFDLFEKKLDPSINSDIAIELGEETILIVYRSAEFQFITFPGSTALNYPFIYMGLQKALYKMIVENSEDHESLYIDEMEPPSNGLSFKLYNLLKSKFVNELNINNIDQVIYSISDRIIEKYVQVVKGIGDNGN